MEYEISNTLKIIIIILLFGAKVKNKACLLQLLSHFGPLVSLRALRSHLGVTGKSAVGRAQNVNIITLKAVFISYYLIFCSSLYFKYYSTDKLRPYGGGIRIKNQMKYLAVIVSYFCAIYIIPSTCGNCSTRGNYTGSPTLNQN